jgi:type I restriction enzyme, S subunit
VTNQLVPLGTLAEFINGLAFGPEDWGETGQPIIRIQNLRDPCKQFNRTMRPVPARYQVQPGELLVSWSATLGVFEWAGPEIGLLNQHIFRVIPDPSRVDVRYLRHGLEMAIQDVQRHLHGATMKHVNRGEFLSTSLFLPSIAEQRRVADLLDHAHRVRAKREECLALLDVLIESIFLDMFGDPARNPKAWRTCKLGDIAEVQGGLQITTARVGYPLEVPYLRVANVYRGYLDLQEIKTLRATAAEIARTMLVKNDLLIVEGHGNPDEIGRGALWDGSIANCVHQNHLIRVRFQDRKVVPLYACMFLNSPGGRQHLKRSGKTTSGLNTISVSEVKAAPLALAPLSLQQQFACRVAAVEKLKVSHRNSLAEMDALFATVQYRAFRGEL